MKIAMGSASCTFVNSTSNDTSFSGFACHGHTYQGGKLYDQKIQQDSVDVEVPTPPPTCDSLFTVSGSTITRDSAFPLTIIFAVSPPQQRVLPGVPGFHEHGDRRLLSSVRISPVLA